MTEWDSFIKELLSKADIVALVSKYVHLTKKGASHWGYCPFHHEKTASFHVEENRQMFYCFGCHTGGNAITFLSKIESVSNIEAIKMLADSLNMRLPESELKEKTDWEQLKKKKSRLVSLLKDAAIHYHDNLKLPQAKPATDYLKRRNIDGRMIKRFGIGYSLGYNELIEHLKTKGYDYIEMREAGVAAQKADRHYDVFFKRLMIPIIDPNGGVIAFGGRLLEESDFAKYKNSAQSIVFDKSKTLFALNLVKKKKQTEGLKSIIIAEGYMDVIALHKAGFETAVASMGTALTLDQAKLIKNYCENVYISFDGDSAGQRAALRGLDILKEAGLNVKVIMLPDKADPDDVINKYGAESYRRLIEKALPLTAFKIETLKKNYNLTEADGRSAFAADAVKIIKRLENPVEREEYLRQINKISGYTMQVLYKQADLPEPEPVPVILISEEKEETQKASAQAKEFILSQIIAAKPYADLTEDIFMLLEDEKLERLYSAIMKAVKEEDYYAGLIYSLIDETDEEVLNRLINYSPQAGDGPEKYYDCISLLKRNKIDKRIDELKAEFNKTKDKELINEIKSLQAEINELKRR